MSEETNPTNQVPEAEDTKTKKTIRLRPVVAKAAPVINPAAAVKPAAQAVAAAAGDDTKTRKTIKLKPLMPKVAAAGSTVDPLAIPKPAAVKPAVQAASEAAGDDTRTRKTIKMKPLMPKVAATGNTVDPLAIPKPAAFQLDGDNTKTRRAVQLSQAQATVKPATIDISKAKAPEAGSTDDDRTVKVKRPAPIAPAKPIIPAAPAETPRPALKFNRPATPKPAAAVVPPRPAVAPAAPVIPVPEVPAAADDEVYDFDDEETPSKLQMVCSVVAAVALLISGGLLVINYFNVLL